MIGFRPQTQKLASPYKTPLSTLAVKGSKYPRLNSGTVTVREWHLSGHRVRVCTQFLLDPGQFTALYSLLRSCFRMASDRAKWSRYVRSHISGTQGVNATPFCAGTQTLVRGTKCGHSPILLPP